MSAALDVARRLAVAANKPEGRSLLRELFSELVRPKQLLSELEAWFGRAPRPQSSAPIGAYTSPLSKIANTFAAAGYDAQAARILATGIVLRAGRMWPANDDTFLTVRVAAERLTESGIGLLKAGRAEGVTLIGAAHRVVPGLAFPIKEIAANLGRIPRRQPASVERTDAQALTSAAHNLFLSGRHDAAARIGTLIRALLPTLSVDKLFDELESAALPAAKHIIKAGRAMLAKGYAAEAGDLLIDSDAVSPKQVWARLDKDIMGPSADPNAASWRDFSSKDSRPTGVSQPPSRMHPPQKAKRSRTKKEAAPPKRERRVVDPLPGHPFQLPRRRAAAKAPVSLPHKTRAKRSAAKSAIRSSGARAATPRATKEVDDVFVAEREPPPTVSANGPPGPSPGPTANGGRSTGAARGGGPAGTGAGGGGDGGGVGNGDGASDKPRDMRGRTFFFELGDGAEGDEAKWGATFDLAFKYEAPPPVTLAKVEADKLKRLAESGGTLRIDVNPAGLELADGIAARVVKFQNGEMIGKANFRLQAPAKGTGEPPSPCGVSVTFSIDRRPIYDFFLPIRLVDALSHGPYPDVKLKLDLTDLTPSAAAKPRKALVFISGVDKWRAHWTIEGDSLDPAEPEDLTVVTPATLQAAYEADILNDLKAIANKPVWKSITETLELPDSPEIKDAARTCMRKAMTAGWKLYDHLAQDPVFKKLLTQLDALPDRSRITFKTEAAAFPWELLYPLQYNNGYPKKNENPKKLWGARFHIESLLITRQEAEKLPAEPQQPGKINVGMAVNKSIDEKWQGTPAPVQLHKDYFEKALKDRGGYFDSYGDILRMFRESYDASLIYFFCHGSANKLLFDNVNDAVTAASVFTDDTYPGWPVIFLNACEAGDIFPLSFYNFRTKFRAKKAFGLIAPSFPIPTLFAAVFARTVLDKYAAHRPVGEILFDLRRQLLQRDNPLGLWYSLQCPMEVQAPSQ